MKTKTKFGPIYALASNGKIKMWEGKVRPTAEGATITYTFGYEDGKQQSQNKIITEGKNLGKKNETTAFEQACKDAESKYNKKCDAGYQEDKDDLTVPILPMLAHPYSKRGHNINWPCYVQPKIDGCFVGNTLISTDQGLKSIKKIVDNELNLSVQSYNEETKKFEYKPIINWFYNGRSSYKNWCEITPEKGQRKQCTLNHKFLTNEGWVEAGALTESHKILDNNYQSRLNSLLAGTLLGDSSMVIEKRGSGTSYRLNFSHVDKQYFDFKKEILGLEGNIVEYTTGYGSHAYRFISKALTQTEFPITTFYFTGHNKKVGKRKFLLEKILSKYITDEALSLWIADDGSLSYNNKNKYTPILSIATHNHSDKQLNEFIKYFQKQWKCVPTLIKDKRVNTETGISGKFLKFNTKDTLYILNQLKHVACKGYEYKYYFTEELIYIKPVEDKFQFVSFTKRAARNSDLIHKYDIEVQGNHNYVANGTVVHNCRCTFTMKNDVITMFTRKGKEFTPMPRLADAIQLLYKKISEEHFSTEGLYFDGELYSDTLTFQELAGALRRHKNTDETLSQIYLVVFDLFYLNKEHDFSNRTDMLDVFFREFRNDNIKLIETEMATDAASVNVYHQEYIKSGYEGIMLRNTKGIYKLNHRSADLQKLKMFQDEEFEIVGFKEGEGIEKGCVVWQCTTGAYTFWVRPKGTQDARKVLFKSGYSYIGKQLTVRYQELTDDAIPRFPVGISIRDYE